MPAGRSVPQCVREQIVEDLPQPGRIGLQRQCLGSFDVQGDPRARRVGAVRFGELSHDHSRITRPALQQEVPGLRKCEELQVAGDPLHTPRLVEHEPAECRVIETETIVRSFDPTADVRERAAQLVGDIAEQASARRFVSGDFAGHAIERGTDGKPSGVRLFPNGEGEGQLATLTGDALPKERMPVAISATARERVAGTYWTGPMQLRVFADGEQLKAQLTGQDALAIFAESENRFYLTVVDAQLVFAPDSGPVERVTLHQNGAETVFTRSAAHE